MGDSKENPKPLSAREWTLYKRKPDCYGWEVAQPDGYCWPVSEPAPESVHVIEKSAYDALKTENCIQWDMQELAKRILKQERDALKAELEDVKSTLAYVRGRKGEITIERDAILHEKPMLMWLTRDRGEFLEEIKRLTAENKRLREACSNHLSTMNDINAHLGFPFSQPLIHFRKALEEFE